MVKYSTKSLLDNTVKTRPRIRASRGYGRAVMLDSEEEVKKALAERPVERTQMTWVHNLKEAVALLGNDNEARGIWELAKEIQAHGTLTIGTEKLRIPNLDHREVDPETGEIILPYGRTEPRPIPAEALRAIQEARNMGIRYHQQKLSDFESRLKKKLLNAGMTSTSIESSTTISTTEAESEPSPPGKTSARGSGRSRVGADD